MVFGEALYHVRFDNYLRFEFIFEPHNAPQSKEESLTAQNITLTLLIRAQHYQILLLHFCMKITQRKFL